MENNTSNTKTFKPTISDSFNVGIQVMSENFITLLLVVLLVGFIEAPIHIFRGIGQIGLGHGHGPIEYSILGVFTIFAIAYGFLIVSVFDYGGSLMFVKAVRGEKSDFTIMYRGFKENYVDIVLANLLVFGIVLLGIIMLVVPGIIFACRLAFVRYLVMDKKMSAVEAVEVSWRMTRSHGWKIFLMGILSFFIILIGLLLLIVGIIPAIMIVSSIFATLYEAVLNENGNHELTEKE